MSAPVKLVGNPTGPMQFIKGLGMEVATFLEAPGGKAPALNYHVPLHMRGPYRVTDLPEAIRSSVELRTDPMGYVLCGGKTAAKEDCMKRAENRSPRCVVHGGRIHPLDKIMKDEETSSNRFEQQSLTRYQLFKAGQLTVEDLDDEELATCGFRAKDGRIYKPRNVPRELVQQFTKAIYERAQQELKSHTVKAAQTVAEIMMSKSVEPDIRLKAANTLLDRGLGKAPQQINVTADVTGFEAVFEGIFSGPRAERPTIDAEVISDERYPATQTDDPQLQRNQYGGNESQPSFDFGTPQLDSGESAIVGEDQFDDRNLERNPAILAQTVEIKPFEYDVSDHSEEIKKATRKRYATRASEDDYPFARVEMPNGMFRHVDPKQVKMPGAKRNSKAEARKRYTLSDFD